MKYIYLSILALFFVIPFIGSAHPGNTASDGMHYCWTNCASWGEVYGQRHSHGGGYSAPSYNYYSAPATPSCPSNSYASGSSCKCNYGYVVSGSSCVSGNTLCHSQLGIMSSYDSLSGKCKCDYGYVIGNSGSCVYESTSSSYYGGSSYVSDADCPAHSSENDDGGCSCDFGYKVNAKKDKCVKLTKKDNDKMCQADFGKKSEWTGKYDKVNEAPYCKCKKKYEWNDEGTKCVITL